MAIGQHLLFTLVSVAIGFALGLVLGILLSRRPKLSGVVLPVLSVLTDNAAAVDLRIVR